MEYCTCSSASEEERCLEHPKFSRFYRIVRKLGRRAYGSFYVCRKVERDEEFAVRVFDFHRLSPVEFMKKDEEISILRQLKHVCIVRFIEKLCGPRYGYFVFELLKGGTLYDEVERDGYCDESKLAMYMGQILWAVKYLHDKQIIHRNLKLKNILHVGKRPGLALKLANFGRAVRLNSDGKYSGQLQEESDYAAPELMEEGSYGKPVDLWACGVILYKLIAGLVPLDTTIFDKDRQDVSPRWGAIGLPLEAKILVKKLLVVNQQDRITADDACLSFEVEEMVDECEHESEIFQCCSKDSGHDDTVVCFGCSAGDCC